MMQKRYIFPRKKHNNANTYICTAGMEEEQLGYVKFSSLHIYITELLWCLLVVGITNLRLLLLVLK